MTGGADLPNDQQIGRGDLIHTDLIHTVLERDTWSELEAEHQHQVDGLTADHRTRTRENHTHPVEDFLFTYYSLRPSQLRRWHPGAGIALLDADDRALWRFHRTVAIPGNAQTPARPALAAVVADVTTFLAVRAKSVSFIRGLLGRTAAAAPQYGCFGLHEWAMVFRTDDRRHLAWPLRLGPDGTDQVVQDHQIRCSHFDAFRFFTPAAKPRNLLSPDLDSRQEMEQPGCLHAGMDLYKWAYRLTPIISSGLLLDCFRLARAIREIDMRASPYDLLALGYPPITIETPSGKAEYVAAQRQFAEQSQGLRRRLLVECDAVFG